MVTKQEDLIIGSGPPPSAEYWEALFTGWYMIITAAETAGVIVAGPLGAFVEYLVTSTTGSVARKWKWPQGMPGPVVMFIEMETGDQITCSQNDYTSFHYVGKKKPELEMGQGT